MNPAKGLQGDPAPELLDGRIWVDGCWDFFHHGMSTLGRVLFGGNF